MDAAIFMRFTRMCRNIFLCLAVLCCCIQIPINWYKNANPESPWLQKITPMNVWNQWQWATVVMSWVTTLIVCFFLWWNYRKISQLRIQYFKSEEYQQSLHARTLMVCYIRPLSHCLSMLTKRLLAVRYPEKIDLR